MTAQKYLISQQFKAYQFRRQQVARARGLVTCRGDRVYNPFVDGYTSASRYQYHLAILAAWIVRNEIRASVQ